MRQSFIKMECMILEFDILQNRMAEEVIAVDYSFEEVGKHLKGSKHRYVWTFHLAGRIHTLMCDASIVSSKVKIQANGKWILETDLWAGQAFQHSFALQGSHCIILQQGDRFQLRINNKNFLNMLNQQKTKKEFKNYEESVEDIKVSEKLKREGAEKVTLNISALDGMKKKKGPAQSQNWDQMQDQEAAINYFKKSSHPVPEYCPQAQSVTKVVQESVSLIENSTPPPEEFNTMQNMFQTQCMTAGQLQKESPAPTVNALNLMEDFSTMQNLFSTQVAGLQSVLQTPPQKVNGKVEEFSTMQQLFSTQLQPTALIDSHLTTSIAHRIEEKDAAQITSMNPQQFSTMQQLFSTQSPLPDANPSLMGLGALNGFQIPNPQQFCTMQNMFATQQYSLPAPVQPNMPPPVCKEQKEQIPPVNIQDFSTMQNLFATMNVSNAAFMSPSPLGELRNSDNTKVECNRKGSSVNAEDFTTMQNLFKTRVGLDLLENSPQ